MKNRRYIYAFHSVEPDLLATSTEELIFRAEIFRKTWTNNLSQNLCFTRPFFLDSQIEYSNFPAWILIERKYPDR